MASGDVARVRGPLLVDADGSWHFVRIPAEVRSAWADRARRGVIRVSATVGGSSWEGALMPWADGACQLTVNALVRRREGLAVGDEVLVELRVSQH